MKKLDLIKPGGARGHQLSSLAREINDGQDAIDSLEDQTKKKGAEWLCEVRLQGQRLLKVKEIVARQMARMAQGELPAHNPKRATLHANALKYARPGAFGKREQPEPLRAPLCRFPRRIQRRIQTREKLARIH